MVAEGLKERFISGSAVIGPMQIFESLSSHPVAVAARLLDRAERLAGPATGAFAAGASATGAFYSWLQKAMGAAEAGAAFAFFGTAVYGNHGHIARDVDTLLFRPDLYSWDFPLSRPHFLHTHDIYERGSSFGGYAESWQFLMAHNLLLYPAGPPQFVMDKIRLARDTILQKPFLEGGAGDLLTYAMFKILNNRDVYLDELHEPRLAAMRFNIEWKVTDLSSMLVRPISLPELHSQVKDQLGQMGDPEIATLARAAMRRLRVKKEKRQELGDRYLQELRRRR